MNSSRFNRNVDHSVNTEVTRVQRVEVITDVECRREWTDEKKQAISASLANDLLGLGRKGSSCEEAYDI